MQFKLVANYIRQTQEVELLTTNQQGKPFIVGIIIPTHDGFKLISRNLEQSSIEGPAASGLMAWNYRLTHMPQLQIPIRPEAA